MVKAFVKIYRLCLKIAPKLDLFKKKKKRITMLLKIWDNESIIIKSNS
jgi:hypothetical protein